MKRRWGTVAILAATALLAGCTGIPTASSPRTIAPVELGNGPPPSIVAPAPDIDPRGLVIAFLGANAIASPTAAQAKAYLTNAASLKWTTNTVTVIDGDSRVVGAYQPGPSEVVVKARAVGTVNSAGVYTPNLQDTAAVPYVVHITKVRGQYRIDGPPKGLLIDLDQFSQVFHQRNLYFYDLADRYLVPDQRWTSATGLVLETWLLNRLADGPRPELQNAVNSDTLPNQPNPSRLSVTSGVPTRIEVPGSSQLDPGTRYRLAAQLGRTFDGAVSGLTMVLTDGNVEVPISPNTVQFTGSQFVDAVGPARPDPDIYYVSGGRIRSEDGKELPGAANGPGPPITSVAMMRTASSSPLAVAAVTGSGPAQRLLVGTQFGGLAATPVVGELSRPSWTPVSSEVWIGQGRGIVRLTVGPTGKVGAPNRVALPAISGAKQVVALRFSPEGSRLAIVIATVAGAKELYMGAIVRSAGSVRVDTLTPISPPSVVVTDVGWGEPTHLFAIGYDVSNQDPRIFETEVDGAGWNERSIGLLPGAPKSLTATSGYLAWVSADGGVWRQSGSSWASPDGEGQRNGVNPVFLE